LHAHDGRGHVQRIYGGTKEIMKEVIARSPGMNKG
jgi:alkylation response protein AidB-like acyl-CoA dehydrogenase